MSDQPVPSDRLVEVQQLTSALTDQVLDAQIMNRQIPAEQAHALAKGARLLHDNGVAWPSMLNQVLQTLMDGSNETGSNPEPSIKQPTS